MSYSISSVIFFSVFIPIYIKGYHRTEIHNLNSKQKSISLLLVIFFRKKKRFWKSIFTEYYWDKTLAMLLSFSQTIQGDFVRIPEVRQRT